MSVNPWMMQQLQAQQNWARLQQFRAQERVVRDRERRAQIHDHMAEALERQGKTAAAEQARGVGRLIRDDPDWLYLGASDAAPNRDEDARL